MMLEGDYWSALEFRVSREMSGIAACRARGLWCDGFVPADYEISAQPPVIRGSVWIGLGAGSQEQWGFTLILPRSFSERDPIDWSQLLPADDVTGWLSVELDARRLEVDPAAAIPDEVAAPPDRAFLPHEELVVLGAVGADGPGGVGTDTEGTWLLEVELEPWKTPSGPLQKTPLRIHKRVPKGELRPLMDRLGTHTLVELLVRGAGDRAELLQVLNSSVTDPELVREAERLQQPVTITLPDLGELTLDRRVGWFERDVLWCGRTVRLALDTDDQRDPSGSAATATVLLGDDENWDRRIREFAVAQLLELKNESWLDEGEPRVSAEQFLDRMRLESITTSIDGSFAFWHDDGDLFWGHAIEVSGNLRDGPTRADIPG